MLRYVCSTCGKGFASARSTRRHIATVESGNGHVISEAEHRIGLLTGTIPIPTIKQRVPNRAGNFRLSKVMREEFFKGYFRRFGEKKFDDADAKLRNTLLVSIFQSLNGSDNTFDFDLLYKILSAQDTEQSEPI